MVCFNVMHISTANIFDASIIITAVIVLVYILLGRVDERDLQRSFAVLLNLRRFFATGFVGVEKLRWLGRAEGESACRVPRIRGTVCKLETRMRVPWVWTGSGW